jgi:hypothetical protein
LRRPSRSGSGLLAGAATSTMAVAVMRQLPPSSPGPGT